jgi:cobalt-precorrin 5A hydrolase / precorrin-3B C17-methyltransferase
MSSYVIGAGCSRGCPSAELLELVEHVLGQAGATPGQVRAMATIDTRANETALVEVAEAMHWPLETHTADKLGAVDVPTPSSVVALHAGTASVAEAASLLSAGNGRIVVTKQRSAHATCALVEVVE